MVVIKTGVEYSNYPIKYLGYGNFIKVNAKITTFNSFAFDSSKLENVIILIIINFIIKNEF